MDKELIILEQIQNNPHVRQRDLATIAKASLGMTNAILKRFAEKGLITISKVNNRNIRYVLTSHGLEEINKRSWGYFKRTIKNVVDYKDVLQQIVTTAQEEGYKGICLVGESDLAFMVEHVCYKQHIPYTHIEQKPLQEAEGVFFILSEDKQTLQDTGKENAFSLCRLGIGSKR